MGWFGAELEGSKLYTFFLLIISLSLSLSLSLDFSFDFTQFYLFFLHVCFRYKEKLAAAQLAYVDYAQRTVFDCFTKIYFFYLQTCFFLFFL